MPYYMKVTSVAADGESKQLPLELPVAQVLAGDTGSAAVVSLIKIVRLLDLISQLP